MRKMLSLLALLIIFSLPTLGGEMPNTVIAPPPHQHLAITTLDQHDQGVANSGDIPDTVTTVIVEEFINLVAMLPFGL